MFTRFDISILVLGMPFDGDTLEARSLGGSESAAVYMAKALVTEGARVSVFCNTTRTSSDREGVQYRPASEWPAFASRTPHDVCIVQRTPEVLSQRTNARLNVLWCHDLALGRQDRALHGSLWNIDRIFVLSQFMRRQYSKVFGLDEDNLYLSRNGVDLSLFRALTEKGIERDRRKLIYAARPERGLDILLREVMPRLLEKEPAARLFIASYDNSQPEWREFYDECDRLATRLGDRVVHLGALSKRELYAHYLSAGVYVYPTPSPVMPAFREVSCISAMECQAAGLPIVTTTAGALAETIAREAGVLVDIDPSDPGALPEYVERFVSGIVGLVRDDATWKAASDAGRARANGLDWSGVAREWLAEFESMIRSRNDSRGRLTRHLWRTSDIVAAKRLLCTPPPESATPHESDGALRQLLAPWAFMDEPEGYRKQYEDIREGIHEYVYDAPLDLRFSLLEDWLEARAEVVDVLDYGCAHGAYAIGLVQRLRYLRVHGVDIDHYVTEAATGEASRVGVSDRARFSVWTHDAASPILPERPEGKAFDCALLQEVLEHVPEPWAVLERVEAQVRPGGKVYITVPFGPWEFTSYRSNPHRCHIWHFDAHDLRDMIGTKPDLVLSACYAADNPLTGEPQGWWIVSYTVDHRPIPPVDLERHLWLQRPRQTVSAAIIAGPHAEDMLHWTLRSIQDVVDETIIADCGMSAEARRIAAQYDVRLVQGVDPTTEGFERARNTSLDACLGDWCLWIDTDEKLVGVPMVDKYLRENAYHGYAIRQHNFACDIASSPDSPVRLFRRRPHKGQSLRFWGAIHEHPEFGINSGSGPNICLPDVHLAHVGYLSEGVRRARFERNAPLLALDQLRYPDRLLQKHFIIRDTAHLVRFALQGNGGRVTETMRARCREIVALYRSHFLGKSHPMAASALEYYSEALTILDEGFETVFQIEAGKGEVKPNGVRRYRFASTEDFNAELRRSVAEKAGRFDSKWW